MHSTRFLVNHRLGVPLLAASNLGDVLIQESITPNASIRHDSVVENSSSEINIHSPGNDTLTYTWNFGDGSNPVDGKDVSHIFADNGAYTVTVTVITIKDRTITEGDNGSQGCNLHC